MKAFGSRGGPASGSRGSYNLGPGGYPRGRGQSRGHGVAQPFRGGYGNGDTQRHYDSHFAEPPSKRGRGGHRGRGDYGRY